MNPKYKDQPSIVYRGGVVVYVYETFKYIMW